MASFEIAFGNVEGSDEKTEFLNVGFCLRRSSEIWFGDDFAEWNAGTVKVDVGFSVGAVNVFCGIFFKVHAFDADGNGQSRVTALGVFHIDDYTAVAHDGKVELGYLIGLGEVGVEIVFAVKLGVFGDGSVEREAEEDCGAKCCGVGNRKCSRVSNTNRANMGVWRTSFVVSIAATEHLCFGVELDMSFESDDWLQIHKIIRQEILLLISLVLLRWWDLLRRTAPCGRR